MSKQELEQVAEAIENELNKQFGFDAEFKVERVEVEMVDGELKTKCHVVFDVVLIPEDGYIGLVGY